MVSMGPQYGIFPRFDTPQIQLDSAMLMSARIPKRNVFTDGIRFTSITLQSFNVTSNDQISMSETGFDDSSGSPITRVQVDRRTELPDWLKREFAYDVQVFPVERRQEFNLYPAFGRVVEVDWIRERICIELLESSLPGLIALSFKKEVSELIPRWLREEGQSFEAWATLAVNDSASFYIGDFEPIEEVSAEDIAEELIRRAVSTHEIRF